MLQRLDFVPCDIGGFVKDTRTRESLAALFMQRGWTAVAISEADGELVPHAVGLWAKDGVEIYLPVSGVAVVRGRELAAGTHTVAGAALLSSRVTVHRDVVSGRPGALAEALRVLTAASSIVAQQDGFVRRPGDLCRFRYAMSVFVASSDVDLGTVAALARPRIVGCSASESSGAPPDPAEIAERVRAIDPIVIESVEERAEGRRFSVWATWSSVVCRARSAVVEDVESLVSLISLVEYRVQSSWFAAQLYGDIAADFCTGARRAVGAREFDWLSVEFDAIALSAERRIGSGAPEEQQGIFHAVVATSGLADEVARATRSIEVGRRISALTTVDRNHRSLILTEILLLVFAAAGVGQLVLRLPVNSVDAVTSQWPFVLALAVLVLIGGLLISRRHR